MSAEILTRLLSKARTDPTTECWNWTAGKDEFGYGRFGFRGRNNRAYRVAYILLVGEVPEGLELDHLCRNRACINPAHLEPVTHRENILRGKNHVAEQSKRTHCREGHPYVLKNWPSGRVRYCPICRENYRRAKRQVRT